MSETNPATNENQEGFLKKHGLLIISLILYVAVYLISLKFPVWVDKIESFRAVKGKMETKTIVYDNSDILKIYLPEVLPNNKVIEKIPLDFLFYGIADVAAPIHFGVFFSVGLITYAVMLINFVLGKFNKDKKIGNGEMFAVNYLISNVVFYPLTFLIRDLDPILTGCVDYVGNLSNKDISTALKIGCGLLMFAMMLVLLVGFFLPCIVNIASLFLYIIAFKPLNKIIRLINKLPAKGMVHDVITAVIAIALILAFNLLFSFLLEKAQGLSIKPLKMIYERKHPPQNQTPPPVNDAQALDQLFSNTQNNSNDSSQEEDPDLFVTGEL